jgi:ribonuclease BN (tRNA processing enzyme)
MEHRVMNKQLNTIADISCFYYACIYHFMGHDAIAKDLLDRSDDEETDTCIKNIASELKEFIKHTETYHGKNKLKDRISYGNEKNLLQYYEQIFKDLNDIIRDRRYFDEKEFPRNSFEKNPSIIEENENINERIRMIIIYILRGHTGFWSKETWEGSSLGASRAALNDLYQADMLIHDLIFSMRYDPETGEQYSWDINKYNTIIEREGDTADKTSYIYLINTIICILHIFKGNIYNKIHFYKNALDNYYFTIRKYEMLVNSRMPVISTDDNTKMADKKLSKNDFIHVCPTIIKTYYEVANILFDKGRIVDSLINIIKAINLAVRIVYLEKDGHGRTKENKELLDNTYKLIKTLQNINSENVEYIRKDLIISLLIKPDENNDFIEELNAIIEEFNESVSREDKKPKSSIPIKLFKNISLIDHRTINDFSKRIPKDQNNIVKSLLSDLVSKLGFILYTVKPRIELKKFHGNSSLKTRLMEFNKAMDREIIEYFRCVDNYQSEFGIYVLTLLNKKNKGEEFHSAKIDRVFRASVSDTLKKEDAAVGKNVENLQGFSEEMIKHSLLNIGHIASLPFQITKYLAHGGYKERVSLHRRNSINKFVILRRWQSFNPKVPRPKGEDIRGGGYFLFWQGKGFVVDPGFNFIQNFYEQGYSINDIDAIVVTHTHPDHDDELNSILTLLAEWNEVNKVQKKLKGGISKNGEDEPKYIDLFLNEGAYRKYNSWVYAKKIMIRKIFILQTNRWHKQSKPKDKNGEVNIDARQTINLKEKYALDIEVIPAWHDELIDMHSSVGLKFVLYDKDNCDGPVLRIGITGDTEYYANIVEMYNDTDILLAHVGDVKFRELLNYYKEEKKHISITQFIDNWSGDNENSDTKKIILKDYLISQQLYGLKPEDVEQKSKHKENGEPPSEEEQFDKLIGEDNYAEIKKLVRQYSIPQNNFRYKNHLGIEGLFQLHKMMISSANGGRSKLMIIGELPEELLSYRHAIACLLDEIPVDNQVKCLTGDIGLTIGLKTEGYSFSNDKHSVPYIAIRCMKCNQNNEYIKGGTDVKGKDGKESKDIILPHYHDIFSIQERCLKANYSRIAWFCQEYNHASNPDYAPPEFFIDPELGLAWD